MSRDELKINTYLYGSGRINTSGANEDSDSDISDKENHL